MKETEQQDQFLRWLDGEIAVWSDSQLLKSAAGEEFEAVLDRIRINIGHVFRHMFLLTLEQNSSLGQFDTRIRTLLETDIDPLRRQPLIFTLLLEKISHPWGEDLTKASDHGDREAMVKERIKLEVTALIREKFTSLYPEIVSRERGS